MAKKKGGGSENNDNTTLLYVCLVCISVFMSVIIYIMYNSLSKADNIIQVNTGGQSPFFDLYSPPLRENPYITRNHSFTQMGIIKDNNNNIFLPLFGRPLSTRRDQWQYYTLSNTGTLPGIKLSLTNSKGRDLMDDYGASELYDKDTVIVDGYDAPMIVSLYKQNTLSYI